jgi:large subunit ribosomal protein L13
MKTHHPKLKEVDQNRAWHVIDAEGVVLGKISTLVADVLRGKNKPTWHPSLDCGDNVIVINAEKIVLTGSKDESKEYIHHTGYPGAIRRITAGKMRAEHPERIIQKAVAGMVPRNRLRTHVLGKLHIYAGSEHPHAGQNPQPLTLK